MIAAVVTAFIVAAIGELNVRAPPFFQNATGISSPRSPPRSLMPDRPGIGIDIQPSRIIASGITSCSPAYPVQSPGRDHRRTGDRLPSSSTPCCSPAASSRASPSAGHRLHRHAAAADHAPRPQFRGIHRPGIAGSAASVAFALASTPVEGTRRLRRHALLGSMLYYWLLLPAGVNPVAAAGAAATVASCRWPVVRRSSIPPLVPPSRRDASSPASIYRGLHARSTVSRSTASRPGRGTGHRHRTGRGHCARRMAGRQMRRRRD